MREALSHISSVVGFALDLSWTVPATITRYVVIVAPLVAISVFAVALSVVVARLFGRRRPVKESHSSSSGAVSVEVLKERLARGEIDKEEFEKCSGQLAD